jgi:antirestriction protein ArdC
MRQLKVKEYYEKLEEGVQAILDSDKVKEFLRVTAMFRKYSFANTLMIYSQKPNASKVAGMFTWNKLGRHVKKGEKGIAIFAPLVSKPHKKAEKDEGTEEAVADSNGTVAEGNESGESRLLGFKVVYVFDVGQTDGKELPDNELSASTDAFVFDGDASALFRKLVGTCPVSVAHGEWDGTAKGYYVPCNKETNGPLIMMHKRLTDVEKPKVLVHEWAHHIAIKELKEHTLQLADRPAGEVIAEGAAFVVCSALGLDTSSYSFNYVAAWGRDIKMILTWGNAVQRVAAKILEALEKSKAAGELNKAA